MLRDNLLVKPLDKEQVGKVVLPDSVQDDWYRGKVISVGPGRNNALGKKEPEVKVGDIVVYPPPFRGIYPTVVVEGEELIILPENDIWAIE